MLTIKQKIYAYWYNFSWPDYIWMFDSWLSRFSLTVPIVGYLIIFNDLVAQHLSFSIITQSKYNGFLNESGRLKLIYFGMILLGISNILYRMCRPKSIKIGRNEFEYVNAILENATVYDLIEINDHISSNKNYTLYGKYNEYEFDNFLEKALGPITKNYDRDYSKADWNSAKNMYESLIRSMLLEIYGQRKRQKRKYLLICIIVSATGIILLSIPSIDLIYQVILITISDIFE